MALLPAPLAVADTPAPAPKAPAANAAIAQDLRSFGQFGSVLYIAAHPDDENTQLIAYLARGRACRTAYLSLTRGDGGQNLLGPEFGDLLGVIRTEELLAARRLDGGIQFFSRARDFGYSKDFALTLKKWDREQVLADIVRVIRTFRPDVLITRFPPEPGGTHGHHTASTVLALEAFRLAGDPGAFPDQLRDLAPWQPKRILWDEYNFGRGTTVASAPGDIQLGIDGRDPVTGMSLLMLAARSRSMHRTQGFANFWMATAGTAPRIETFHLLAGSPASKDIFDGIDTTWGRVAGGAEIGRLADEALAHFDPNDPPASVPALLAIKGKLAALPADPVVDGKRLQLDRIIQACLGISVETTVSKPEIVPGESVGLHFTALVRSRIPVKWVAVHYSGVVATPGGMLIPDSASAFDATWTLPAATPLSQPYWLREEGTPGMFRVDDASLIGRPENPPVIPVEDVFQVGGQTVVLHDEAVSPASAPGQGEVRRRPDVIAPVALGFGSPVALFSPGSGHGVVVEVTAYRAGSRGTLRLEAPATWRIAPSEQAFALAAVGDRARFTFEVTAPPRSESCEILAGVEIGGRRYGNERMEIHYSHIPELVLQPSARLKAVSLDLAIRGRNVGYLPGAGDSAAESLELMGYSVARLTGADLIPEKLKGLDAVVIGVRAFDTRTDLAPRLPDLFAYVGAGGTVVEQYNTPNGLKTKELGPYSIQLSPSLPRYRVTDEDAPVALLQPGHPVFNEPNRIGPADFAGWVQERGLDFASEWDRGHFTPLIACGDAGEAPLQGGLLVAQYGKGYFVYTGLSFFRQLPAGVPGAYRLFANLVSLGK
jgi:LmbE family N-acetylglucosaminyl deacetylase